MIEGSLVALVTPMLASGALDVGALGRLLDFHREHGSDGIVIGGTTGESPTLTPEELETMLGVARDMTGAEMALIAGSGSNDTSRAVELTRRACTAGADACLVVTPYYNKPTQEGLYRHFRSVADAASRPVILYNVPGRTACDLLPATVARLAAHERIIAIKEASTDMTRVEEIRERCGADFVILSGDDASALEAMRRGARGVISVTANVAPGPMRALCSSASAGSYEDAERVDASLRELHAALFVEPNPIPVKWALNKLGLIENVLRLPLTPLAREYHERVGAALRAAAL